MARSVLLTDDAVDDLDEILGYIARRDSTARAVHALESIGAAIAALAEVPDRGAVPAELSALGIRTYREVFFKPYRIVHRVQPDAVIVFLVADGRRDLQSLLQRRLLEP